MPDNTQSFEAISSGEIADEMVRRFLLGDLSAAEQPLFELKLLADDDLDARVGQAELELADDYAFERLSSGHRILFEERFLVTADRQRKLRVSGVLRDRFSQASPERYSAIARVIHLLGLDRPALRIAVAVVVLLVVLGTAWILIKEPRIGQRVANRLLPRRAAPANAPRSANHPTNTAMSEHSVTPASMPVHEPAVARIMTIILEPGTSAQSNAMPGVSLPSTAGTVRLKMFLTPERKGPFRAELIAADGSSVFNANGLTPEGYRPEIDLDVPSNLLKAGVYQIRLSPERDSSGANVESYYFRVR